LFQFVFLLYLFLITCSDCWL